MAAVVAKVFELSKLENFNEEVLSCFDVWYFKLPKEKKQEAIKEFVKEGGLKEYLNRPEENDALDKKLFEALEFYQESLRVECVPTLRDFIDALEPQK